MAEIDVATGNTLWSGFLSLGVLVMGYFLKQKDDQISEIGRKSDALELDVAKNYATKDSLRVLFQETQNSARDSSARLEKQIDETKSAVAATNVKIDNMQTSTNVKIDNMQTTLLAAIGRKE